MGFSSLNKYFVVVLGKYSRIRKRVVIPPELVQLIWQGCPLTLGKIPLKWALTEIRDPFQQVGDYFNSKVGLGSMQGLYPQEFHPNEEILFRIDQMWKVSHTHNNNHGVQTLTNISQQSD